MLIRSGFCRRRRRRQGVGNPPKADRSDRVPYWVTLHANDLAILFASRVSSPARPSDPLVFQSKVQLSSSVDRYESGVGHFLGSR
jgi:hypothetical protein